MESVSADFPSCVVFFLIFDREREKVSVLGIADPAGREEIVSDFVANNDRTGCKEGESSGFEGDFFTGNGVFSADDRSFKRERVFESDNHERELEIY